MSFEYPLKYNYRIVLSILLCLPLIVLVFGGYYWQQISEFAPPLVITLILVFGATVIGKAISTLIAVIARRKELSMKLVLPSLIYIFTLITIYLQPKWFFPEYHASPIKYRGCYEGTINTGTIYFRESGDFEYRHVGFFGITTFEKGSWIQLGDTLIIEYENEVHEFVGDTLLMTEDWFYEVRNDSLVMKRSSFYRGFCRREN